MKRVLEDIVYVAAHFLWVGVLFIGLAALVAAFILTVRWMLEMAR